MKSVLRGRYKKIVTFEALTGEFAWQVQESDTCQKAWQAHVAKTLAGVNHLKDCILRGRRREQHMCFCLHFKLFWAKVRESRNALSASLALLERLYYGDVWNLGTCKLVISNLC